MSGCLGRRGKGMDVLPYAILLDRRAIRVFHSDLGKSWWNRGMSASEKEMQKVESVLKQASGQQRIYRMFSDRHSFVEFRLNAQVFNAAACALRITYAADPYFERMLAKYPAPVSYRTGKAFK
jgi:hypothetical protein